MYWFTADEHYGHEKIIDYCNRPFSTIDNMDTTLINNFNSVVCGDDTTIHAGDFCWCNKKQDAQNKYISKLNGNHVFLKGSHDHWLPDSAKCVWRKMIHGNFVFVCHYAMKTWERHTYNSWQLHGHSHGRLQPEGKQHDIGVDNNDFYPVSYDKIKDIMSLKPDNNPTYVISKLKQEIDTLLKDGEQMSANQCLHPGGIIGDDFGNPQCPLMFKELQ